MASRRQAIIAGLGTAVVSLGLTVAVGTAMAQTATPPAQTATPPAQTQAKANYQNVFLDKLAADLGTTTDKLKSAFTQARNDTVDQEVKDGKLTQQQADRIKANTNAGPGFGFRGFPGGERRGERGIGFMGGGQEQAAIAKALGMTQQDLANQLHSGKTLAQLAQGKEQAVKDAIVNTIKPRLDQAVKNGRMTQDQENQRIDQIQKMDLSKIGGQQGRWQHAPRGSHNQPKPAA